jgi:hypothetical protein
LEDKDLTVMLTASENWALDSEDLVELAVCEWWGSPWFIWKKEGDFCLSLIYAVC